MAEVKVLPGSILPLVWRYPEEDERAYLAFRAWLNGDYEGTDDFWVRAGVEKVARYEEVVEWRERFQWDFRRAVWEEEVKQWRKEQEEIRRQWKAARVQVLWGILERAANALAEMEVRGSWSEIVEAVLKVIDKLRMEVEGEPEKRVRLSGVMAKVGVTGNLSELLGRLSDAELDNLLKVGLPALEAEEGSYRLLGDEGTSSGS
jgi:hypothetical protein